MELFQREYGSKNPPIVILHGILGSSRNWHTIASKLANNNRVIAPDMRNHGQSPHSEVHRLTDMVADVLELQRALGATPAILLGHSMGGLVGMQTAFQASEKVLGLIVVDIAPRPHRAGVVQVIEAMARMRLHQLQSKRDAESALVNAIRNPETVQFVLTNLIIGEGGSRWRVNLPALQEFLIDSQAYQPAPTEIYTGPTLFVRGEKSNYLREEDLPMIQRHFPQARLETVAGAGHWVHYEAPDEVTVLVEEFVATIPSR